VVEEFAAPGGEGETLHTLLEQHAKACNKQTTYPHCSWLEEMWDTVAYLSDPSSLLNVNYFGSAYEERGCPTPLLRTARAIAGMCLYKAQYESGSMEPDYFSSKKEEQLCMFQYTRVLGATRIPGREVDTLEVHGASRHIAVVCCGVWFALDLYDGDAPLTVEQLLVQLQRIDKAARGLRGHALQPPIAALTGEDRRVWARVRDELCAVPGCHESLRAIETALFVVCMDDEAPETADDLIGLLHTGNGTNRWFDKVTQLVTFANGKAGFNGEHSAADAPVPARMLATMEYFVVQQEAESGHDMPDVSEVDAAALPPPRVLEWPVTDSVRAAVDGALAKLQERIANEDHAAVDFDDFGKKWLKQHRVSPDAFVQMALQLAYFRDQGRFTATYETGSTRRFFHGRTETCRAVTKETVAMVKAMRDRRVTSEERARLLRDAVRSNRAYMELACAGKGVDRHLLGLYVVSKQAGMDVPAIFKDPTYARSTTFLLSTSQLTTPILANRPAFPCPFEAGYGTCYGIYGRSLRLTCTAKKSEPGTNAGRFGLLVVQSLRDLGALLELEPRSKL